MAAYPPPPYHQGPPPPQTVVVTAQPVILTGATFRDTPVRLKCQYCSADVVTSTSFETGSMTWVACFVILLVGLFIPFVWLGCCLIPFCVPACKDVIHRCPNCNQILGRFNRM